MPETVISSARPRVLSGMRPTGKLHLGNYMGALANWVKLQDQYECYFFIADLHALTTDYADTSAIAPIRWKWRWIFWPRGLTLPSRRFLCRAR